MLFFSFFFLSFGSRLWTETFALALLPVWRFLSLLLLVLGLRYMYLSMKHLIYIVFIYELEHMMTFTMSGTLPPSQTSPWAPTSLWFIRIMRLTTSKQPFGTDWANMTKALTRPPLTKSHQSNQALAAWDWTTGGLRARHQPQKSGNKSTADIPQSPGQNSLTQIRFRTLLLLHWWLKTTVGLSIYFLSKAVEQNLYVRDGFFFCFRKWYQTSLKWGMSQTLRSG